MTKNPVGHEASVASSCLSDPFSIDGAIFFQDHICKLHKVAVVDGAVFTSDVGKLISSSVSSPWIGPEDEVSFVGPILHLMHEDCAVYCLRPSMDVENGRILLTFFISKWLYDPAGKWNSIVFVVYLLRNSHVFSFQNLRVEFCQALFLL